MNHFFAFLSAHWLLVSLFLLAFAWLMIEEAQHQGMGGARQTPQGVTYLINQLHAQVIDLRDPVAYQDAAIVGSVNIPFSRLNQEQKKLARYQSSPVILVCSNGQQSVKALHQLRQQGFSQLYVLGGGLSAWRQAGMPLKKPG